MQGIKSYIDYYPFGAIMPGRNSNSGDYAYGFNGKENDSEIKGEGNSVDFGARIYDSRLGRWLRMDNYSSKFPYQSPYLFASNSPISATDDNGDSTLFFNSKGRLLGISHDHKENAIVFVPDKNLISYYVYRIKDDYHKLVNFFGKPRTQAEKDSRIDDYRVLGDVYALSGAKQLLQISKKKENVDKTWGVYNEYGAKLYKDDQGIIRIDIKGVYTDNNPMGVTPGNHSASSPDLNVVGDIHSHPNSGDTFPPAGEGPSQTDRDGTPNERYLNMIISNTTIEFYDSKKITSISLPRVGTFKKEELKKTVIFENEK